MHKEGETCNILGVFNEEQIEPPNENCDPSAQAPAASKNDKTQLHAAPTHERQHLSEGQRAALSNQQPSLSDRNSYNSSSDIEKRTTKESVKEVAADASGSTNGVYHSTMADQKMEHVVNNNDMADNDSYDEKSVFETIEVQAGGDQGDNKTEILSKQGSTIESVQPQKLDNTGKTHGDEGDGNFPPTEQHVSNDMAADADADAIEVQAAEQGDKTEILSKGSIESVLPHGDEEENENVISASPITLDNLRSASPLFVKQQDTEEGAPNVDTSKVSPSKGYAFDLTKEFDDQGDADGDDALAGATRSERPVMGNSVSQIEGQTTTEQPKAVVDADVNIFPTKKAKAWKFDLTKFSLTPGGAADPPGDLLESEGIEVTNGTYDSKSKKKGWFKWGRREK